jgi:hypothetical protein
MLTINTLYTQLYTSAINIIYKFTYKLFLYSEIPTVQMRNIHSKYWIQWKNNQNCQHCYQTYCFHPSTLVLVMFGGLFWIFGIIYFIFSLIVQYHVFTQFAMALSPH